MGRNRGIGLRGGLPWHLPGDLQHFKRATLGKPVVMGRKTWESVGRPLPGRQNIVVTRNPDFTAPGAQVAASLEEAVALANPGEVMIVGGGELYREALPVATRLLLTRVDASPEADTFFPAWDVAEWELAHSKAHPADARNEYAWVVEDWQRR